MVMFFFLEKDYYAFIAKNEEKNTFKNFQFLNGPRFN